MSGGELTAQKLKSLQIKNTEDAGVNRLNEELIESKKAIQNGESSATQIKIIDAWEDWYLKAIASSNDMVNDKESLKKTIEKSQGVIKETAKNIAEQLK